MDKNLPSTTARASSAGEKGSSMISSEKQKRHGEKDYPRVSQFIFQIAKITGACNFGSSADMKENIPSRLGKT